MSEKPVVLMPEDIQRIMGKDAQRNNILAARMVAEMVKTTLGPKGMDKMLVSPTGDIIVTNDGVTIISPVGETSILSIPFGPRVVLTISATILAARILFLCASF